jgi:hypothetical protein
MDRKINADIVDKIPEESVSTDFINQQNILNSYKENERKIERENKNLNKLKKTCPIKNSDLVIYDTSKLTWSLKECPNGFIKSADGKQCEMYIDDIDIYRYRKEHNCGEQYIDWITIPNYHLGNSYFKLNTGKSKDDFNGCFEPCNIDFVPYKNKDDKDSKKSKDSIHCVKKSVTDIGRYGIITLDYCPLVLIILLSCDMIDNNEFNGEYIKNTNNKNIEPSIKEKIKDNNLLLKEMKDNMILEGKKYIIHLLKKYKPDFLEKLKLTDFELDKCYKTSILNLSADKREPILHAYNIFKNKDKDLVKYVNAYKYMSNDGNVVELMKLHEKVLKWACEVAFDKNTNYGKRNLFLYEKFSNPNEDIEVLNNEIEYIRKVNKQEIKNENYIFYALDILNPGSIINKLIYKSDNNDIINNSYILGLPFTIFVLSLLIVLIIISILFYKYTKILYYRVKNAFIIILYNIANIFDKNINPKYINTDLLTNVRAQVSNIQTVK